MPLREVSMIVAKEILRLWFGGMGKKLIARLLGLDPKTVRRYVRTAEAAGLRLEQGEGALSEVALASVLAGLHNSRRRPHGDCWSLCENRRPAIERLLDQRVRFSKIRRFLLRQGIVISYATLHRFAVEQLRFGRTAPTIAVADRGPGEELRLGSGWMTRAHVRRVPANGSAVAAEDPGGGTASVSLLSCGDEGRLVNRGAAGDRPDPRGSSERRRARPVRREIAAWGRAGSGCGLIRLEIRARREVADTTARAVTGGVHARLQLDPEMEGVAMWRARC